MVELAGSEKQVKWANDIRAESLRVLEEAYKFVQNVYDVNGVEITEKNKEVYKEGYLHIKEEIEKIDQAKVFIESLRDILKKDDLWWKITILKEEFVRNLDRNLKAARFVMFASKNAFIYRNDLNILNLE